MKKNRNKYMREFYRRKQKEKGLKVRCYKSRKKETEEERKERMREYNRKAQKKFYEKHKEEIKEKKRKAYAVTKLQEK